MLETIGFVFPNDLHIHWSLMIVLYPYITGLVAGAFVVSSLYHVFDMEALKPVSRFALMASLAFLLVATWPLLLHLGHPFRGINVMRTPNPTSAMAGPGSTSSRDGTSRSMMLLALCCRTTTRPATGTHRNGSTSSRNIGPARVPST